MIKVQKQNQLIIFFKKGHNFFFTYSIFILVPDVRRTLLKMQPDLHIWRLNVHAKSFTI